MKLEKYIELKQKMIRAEEEFVFNSICHIYTWTTLLAFLYSITH